MTTEKISISIHESVSERMSNVQSKESITRHFSSFVHFFSSSVISQRISKTISPFPPLSPVFSNAVDVQLSAKLFRL
jgi:hypothetical protein